MKNNKNQNRFNKMRDILAGIESVEIGKKGEEVVVKDLISKDITIDKHDTKAPGATDIEASNDETKFLIQVKSAKLPRNPGNMSSKDLQRIKSRATRINALPYLAKVQLDANLRTKTIRYDEL